MSRSVNMCLLVRSVWQCVAACFSVLQCVAVSCIVLQLQCLVVCWCDHADAHVTINKLEAAENSVLQQCMHIQIYICIHTYIYRNIYEYIYR